MAAPLTVTWIGPTSIWVIPAVTIVPMVNVAKAPADGDHAQARSSASQHLTSEGEQPAPLVARQVRVTVVFWHPVFSGT